MTRYLICSKELINNENLTQTKENEPKLIPVMPFDKTVEFVKAIKNAGVDINNVEFSWDSS